MSTRNVSWGVKAVGRTSDDLTTFMCRLSWNMRALTSWNPQGLSRPALHLLRRIPRKKFQFRLRHHLQFSFSLVLNFHLLVDIGTGFSGVASSIKSHKKLTLTWLWRNFCLLPNSNIHYRFRVNPLSLPILSQKNSIHALTYSFFDL